MIDLEKFSAFLRKTNKSANTVASYCFAARQYTTHFGEFTKKNLLLYKAFLIERFKPKTVNIRLLAMNAYATCISRPTLKMPHTHPAEAVSGECHKRRGLRLLQAEVEQPSGTLLVFRHPLSRCNGGAYKRTPAAESRTRHSRTHRHLFQGR